jgi:hypothetical protein
MLKIFKLLGKNPEEPLTVEEFIESYVYYEEQLKIKLIKIEKFLDDLTEEKKRNEESKKEAELNEYEKENGLTNKSNLFITIIEGKDLDDGGLIGDCNPYVEISFQGNTQKSLVKKNTYNPAWNENFKFEITSLEGTIKVEILNESFLQNKSLGYININLNDLKDQEERFNWYDLNTGKGKIRMKLLCIINLVNYYEAQLNRVNKELSNFQKIYNELNIYEEAMKTPFGIIYIQDLDPLLNTENLRNSQNYIDTKMESKKIVYAPGSMDSEKLKKDNQIKRINWNRFTQLLMIILIGSSFFTLLERTDFLNLFLAIIIMVLFFLDKKNNIEKYLQPLILTIGGSLIYDFIWFITHFVTFFVESDDPEINLKRLIYLVCIGNFLIKACLIKGLNDVKRKKLYSSFRQNQ